MSSAALVPELELVRYLVLLRLSPQVWVAELALEGPWALSLVPALPQARVAPRAAAVLRVLAVPLAPPLPRDSPLAQGLLGTQVLVIPAPTLSSDPGSTIALPHGTLCVPRRPSLGENQALQRQ